MCKDYVVLIGFLYFVLVFINFFVDCVFLIDVFGIGDFRGFVKEIIDVFG